MNDDVTSGLWRPLVVFLAFYANSLEIAGEIDEGVRITNKMSQGSEWLIHQPCLRSYTICVSQKWQKINGSVNNLLR